MTSLAELDRAPSPSESPATRPATTTLRILTLNVHKGFTTFNRRFVLGELRDAVREVGADMVFLQEVLGDDASARPSKIAWPKVPQYEFLADTLWPHFSYGKNAVYPEGHHGNALLSKFPILSHRNIDISIVGPEQRGMLHCVLRQPDWHTDVHAICVHLGLMESHRAKQLELLCGLIGTLPSDAPLILAGDFNDWRCRAGDILQRGAGLKEAFASLEGRSARTFPVRWPLLRLDRIYFRNATASQQSVLSKPPWSRLSDHAGLLTELQF